MLKCGVNACGEGLHCNEIQESLCDAVNNLVKHFYKPEKEASFADLMLLFLAVLLSVLHCVLHWYIYRNVHSFTFYCCVVYDSCAQ